MNMKGMQQLETINEIKNDDDNSLNKRMKKKNVLTEFIDSNDSNDLDYNFLVKESYYR